MAERRPIHLHDSWRSRLLAEFESGWMGELRDFIAARKRAGAEVYPPGQQMFAALDATPFDQVRVVIMGQDPYHGPGQAHGLCFSVSRGVAPPPSLVNVFREINDDLSGQPIAEDAPHRRLDGTHGCLDGWARQGVLLLNAVLTVERGQAGSHQRHGWERFTDRIVELLNAERDGLVFLLWGSHARKKCAMVDEHRHLVLHAPHPSPLSAHRGFFNCQHFSRTNRHLQSLGQQPIDWFEVA